MDVGRGSMPTYVSFTLPCPWRPKRRRNLHQDYERDLSLAQRLLDERAAAAVPASRVKTILRRGEPVHVLAALARDENIDLVVVGTHQHHRAGDILVGSSLSASSGLLRVRWSW